MENKIKKVGIISMQRIKNYGSFLQAYALKSLIEENTNSKVSFVDYHVEKPLIEEKHKFKILEVLFSSVSFKQKFRYLKFKKNFNNYYKLLGIGDNFNYNPKLDILVIGSDEVFNCVQANKNVGYSLELFGKNNNAKKVITYAASFGNTTIDKLKKYGKENEIADLLKNIDAISVRDENSAKVVKKLINKEIVCNLDPVLIFDYINSGLIPEVKFKEKYMILYAYFGRISDEEAQYIRKYAIKNKLKIYAIGGAQKYTNKFIDCTPFEVLTYFKSAECIVTDTFHGSIFSIITQKPFVTLVRKSVYNSYGNEEKLLDLLSKLQLTDRLINDISDLNTILEKHINYKRVNEIIDEERKKSIKYLKSNII